MAGGSASLLEIRDLRTSFFTKRGVVPAVDSVSLRVGQGEIVGLVGESGCGKSVTSLSVLGLVASPGKIIGGHILYHGEDVLGFSAARMRELRGNKVSMIFQEPMTSLNPVYTIGKQVTEALRSHDRMVGSKEARLRAVEMLARVGISEPESRLEAYPHQLSGGLRQRVMIAMALICKPGLLIADEPTTALDVTIEAQILTLMRQLQREIGSSIVLITHNLGVVAETCDRVYVMYAGRIVEEADVFELFDRPLHPYTNGLLRSIPRKNEDESAPRRLYSIKGNVPDMARLPAGCKFAPRCERCVEACTRAELELVDSGNGHFVRCFRPMSDEVKR